MSSNIEITALWTADNSEENYTIQCINATESSTTVSITNHTMAEADMMCFIAAYDSDNRMIACNAESAILGIFEDMSLTTAYSLNGNIPRIKVFVLASDTLAPLRGAWLYP